MQFLAHAFPGAVLVDVLSNQFDPSMCAVGGVISALVLPHPAYERKYPRAVAGGGLCYFVSRSRGQTIAVSLLVGGAVAAIIHQYNTPQTRRDDNPGRDGLGHVSQVQGADVRLTKNAVPEAGQSFPGPTHQRTHPSWWHYVPLFELP